MYTCPCRAKNLGKSAVRQKKTTVRKGKSRKARSHSIRLLSASRGKSKTVNKSKRRANAKTRSLSITPRSRKVTLSCPMPRRIIPILKYK
jgi:hypothetical protein